MSKKKQLAVPADYANLLCEIKDRIRQATQLPDSPIVQQAVAQLPDSLLWSIPLGHLSMLHLSWGRRPLAACRLIVFAMLLALGKEPA